MAERRTLAQLRTERASRGNSLNVEVAGEVPGALANWCHCGSALLALHFRPTRVSLLLAPQGAWWHDPGTWQPLRLQHGSHFHTAGVVVALEKLEANFKGLAGRNPNAEGNAVRAGAGRAAEPVERKRRQV